MVADNDLALGRLVEHISHSPIWKESAIFVLEDDAQNGPDHVDAHRSVAYVLSPYIKRHSVDHTLYSTSSMLRTMEQILGLPPMSQFDAAATPMWNCFGEAPDMTAFIARAPGVDLTTRNLSFVPGMTESAKFDLSRADAIPDALLNEVLWKSLKGVHSPMPAPHRSAFVRVSRMKEDDD